jgi:hypothetical protein
MIYFGHRLADDSQVDIADRKAGNVLDPLDD